MINITKGDVTNPVWKDTNQIIIHNVNSQGGMGTGVALALLKKWPAVRDEYIRWYGRRDGSFQLGSVQFVQVEPKIEVVNLIGQKNIGWESFENLGITIPPVRYEALYEGFVRVRSAIKSRFKPGEKWTEYTFHLPLLGSQLSGGNFEFVFQQYLQAFRGTNSSTMFYAFSDKDYEMLKEIYNKYKDIPEWASTIRKSIHSV